MTAGNSLQESTVSSAFLHRVWPESGRKCLAFKTANGMAHRWFSGAQAAADAAISLDAQGHDVYFGVASFSQDKRDAESAQSVKGFWLDVDCGEGKAYPTQKAGTEAIVEFLRVAGLPTPEFVSSGNGLHLYWCLEREIPAAQWLEVSKQLKGLTRALGLHADPSRTADRASLLRPPGTHNRKDEKFPKLVRVIHSGKATSFETFQAAVQKAIESQKPEVIAERPARAGLNSDLTSLAPKDLIETTANKDRLRSALSSIPADCDRATWRAVVWAIAAAGWTCGKPMAREWSQSCLEKFDDADFEGVWESFRAEGGISVGTVFHHAKLNGWTEPQQLDHTTVLQSLSGATDALPGDIINGRVFARMFGGRLVYVYSRGKWLAWDGSRYVWCGAGEEMQCAKEAAAMVVKLAGEAFAKDPERNKRRMLDAMASQRLPRLDAMVRLAQSEKGMSIPSEGELDADPFLLGCRNGVVDLRTGALLQPDQRMMITRQCAAEYHREATCPRWMRFLNEVFDNDAEHIAYVQRFWGYMLTGCVDEEVMAFAFGHGANGKSVFCNVLRAILGDYAVTGQATMLSKRKGDEGPRNDVARLAGARAIFANETQSGDRFDEQLIKTLVSRDPIAARYLHKEFFEFAPTGKLIVCGNHRPAIVGTDTGIWRRVHLWLFERTFSEEERDPGLESALLEERDGILAWGVEGALLWRQRQLGMSEKVRRATRQYRDESDLLGEWLETECVIGVDRKVSQRQAYLNYVLWCRESGVSSPSKKTFTRQLRERRFSDAGFIGHDRTYTGFELRGRLPPAGGR